MTKKTMLYGDSKKANPITTCKNRKLFDQVEYYTNSI